MYRAADLSLLFAPLDCLQTLHNGRLDHVLRKAQNQQTAKDGLHG